MIWQSELPLNFRIIFVRRLEEATAVFREKYPHLVRMSTEPILPAFSKMFKLFNDQRFIENDVMVHVYNSK